MNKTPKYRLIVESEIFNCDVLLKTITLKYLKSIKTYTQKRIKITIINL